MSNLFYQPCFSESDAGVCKTIKLVDEIRTCSIFLDYDTALNFDNWWTWKRQEDGKISVKGISATKAELFGKSGLTGEYPSSPYKSIQVQLRESTFVEVEPHFLEYYSPFSWYPADWDGNLRIASESRKSTKPDLAIALLGLMQEISKEEYFASWMTGLEYQVWNLIKTKDNPLNIRKEFVIQLWLLSGRCEGLWEWDQQLKFIGLEECQKLLY